MNDYSVVAFVSGKGGVGKTTIATNFAYGVAAGGHDCMLIDVDFQNLGCTGLFEANWPMPDADALTLLRDCPATVETDIAYVTASLRFLPAAFRYPNTDDFLDSTSDIVRRLNHVLAVLRARFSTDVFILDCHGAVDPMSIAAAGVANHTVVVTEPDSVTFAGTLELIDSYYDAYVGTDFTPRISYVVNRIPPKYRWRDLHDLYCKHLVAEGALRDSSASVTFIPTENYIAESFGDYPFQIQLAPKSLFAEKIALLMHQLDPTHNVLSPPREMRKRMNSARQRARVATRVIAKEAANIRMVFVAYSLASLTVVMLLVVIAMAVVFNLTVDAGTALMVVEFGTVPFYVIVMFRIWWYFRDRYLFEAALTTALRGRQKRWRSVRLWKLRALYIGSAIGPCVALVVGVLLSTSLVIAFGAVFFGN